MTGIFCCKVTRI